MFFGNKSKNSKTALYFGAPEAEAESLPNSRVTLSDVYEDHHDLHHELASEKFIVVGRKGAGKSAFAEYTYLLSQSEANIFCTFIRQDVISLEKLVQLGTESQNLVSKEQLFKWLIYTNILGLFFQNEAIREAQEFNLLKEFLKKNSGFIDVNKGEIVELVKKYNFEINIEQFKRFFKGKIGKDIQIKEARAPFYKLIPHLETVIISCLKSELEKNNENEYVVFFDDLDIGFNAESPQSLTTIMDLLRATKHVNNNIFAKNGISAKVIILIRDDVERVISTQGADIAKIFSSYSTRLDWYQDEYQSVNEDQVGLKKLIERRARYAFDRAGIPISEKSAWDNLIKDDFSPKSSFKYIADHTYLRPRDLILFFKPLESGVHNIPLNKQSVNNLLGLYSAALMKELTNELSSFYSGIQIHNIFEALKEINDVYDCSYTRAKEIILENCKNVDPTVLLNDLFERSIIGNFYSEKGYVKFVYRISKKDTTNYKLDESEYIIVHSGVKIYLDRR